MKSSYYYKLLVFALSLASTEIWAADFGDIPANLTLGAGQSVRRNSGNTLFEAYTAQSIALPGTSGNVLTSDGSNWLSLPPVVPTITLSGEVSGSGTTSIATTQTHFVTFDIDGVGIVLSTGTKNPYKIKYGGTLVAWSAMCVPSTGGTCSVSFDLLRAANAAGLPTVSMVGAGTKPLISADVEASGTTFPSWTSTTITAGDNLAISLSGITTAKYAEITFWWK